MGVRVVDPIEFEKRLRSKRQNRPKKITVEIDSELYTLLRRLRDRDGLIIRHVICEGIRMKLREMGYSV